MPTREIGVSHRIYWSVLCVHFRVLFSGAFESAPAVTVSKFTSATDLGFGTSRPNSPRGTSIHDLVRRLHFDEPFCQAKMNGAPWIR